MYLDLVVHMYVHKFYVVFTHKEEALELLDYALGSCCSNVCAEILCFGNLPFLHCHMCFE